MTMPLFVVCLLFVFLAVDAVIVSQRNVDMHRIGRYYPEHVSAGALKKAALTQMKEFDDNSTQLYVVNNLAIDVISLQRVSDLEDGSLSGVEFPVIRSLTVTMPLSAVSSVWFDAVGDMLYATLIPAAFASEPGYLLAINVRDDFATVTDAPIPLGGLCFSPSAVVTTSDGAQIIVSCQGVDGADGQAQRNQLVILDASQLDSDAATVASFDFYDETANLTDAVFANLSASGVYVRNPSQDALAYWQWTAEPTYLSLSEDDGYLYVTFQQSNAVAVFDMDARAVVALLGLGVKDFSASPLDASDRDTPEVNLRTYPALRGLRQPNMVQFWHDAFGQNSFLIAVNQGRTGFSDAVRFNDAAVGTVNASLSAYQTNDTLGRLFISAVQGNVNAASSDSSQLAFSELFAFGGRDFSVYEVEDDLELTLVMDSGADLEHIPTTIISEVGFNSNASFSPSTDTTSVYNGPGPNAMAIGVCYDHAADSFATLLFVAAGNTGGIFVYDMTDVQNIAYVRYVNDRDYSLEFAAGERPSEQVGDVGVEQLLFIGPQSESDYASVLLSVNSVSASVTAYIVNCSTAYVDDGLTTTPAPDTDSGGGGSSGSATKRMSTINVVAIVIGSISILVIIGVAIYMIKDRCSAKQEETEITVDVNVTDDYVELAN